MNELLVKVDTTSSQVQAYRQARNDAQKQLDALEAQHPTIDELPAWSAEIARLAALIEHTTFLGRRAENELSVLKQQLARTF